MPETEREGASHDAAEQKKEEVKSPAAEALGLARAKGVRPFCDRAVIPCVRLPGDPRTWHLRSDRVSAWLAVTYEQATGKLLGRSDLLAVIRVLEGIAYQSPSEDSDEEQLWLRLEEDPLLQAVYEFMHDRPRWEGKTRKLLDELNKVAAECRIDIYTDRWPRITRILSARLNRARGLLAQVAIQVRTEHRRDGSHTILTQVTARDASDAGDAEGWAASQSEYPSGKRIPSRDGCDAGDGEDDRRKTGPGLRRIVVLDADLEARETEDHG